MASWSQGGPFVPGAAAVGKHPPPGGVKRESRVGPGSGGPSDGWGRPGGAGGRAPPGGSGGGEGWATSCPSSARDTGFSIRIMTPPHFPPKVRGGREGERRVSLGGDGSPRQLLGLRGEGEPARGGHQVSRRIACR